MNGLVLEEQSIETRQALAVSQFEDCWQGVAALCVVIEKKSQLENFVRTLISIRDDSLHGTWIPWIESAFGENLSVRHVQRMIAEYENPKLAEDRKSKDRSRSNATGLSHLKNETVPRSERKPASVVVTTPAKTEPADHSDDVGAESENPAADPLPAMPSIRKTAAGTTKVAEDKKPQTQQVPVEFVDDEPRDDEEIVSDWLVATGFIDIVIQAKVMKPDFPQKSAAKVLRKLANMWDPPTKFVKPDLDEVSAYFGELKAVDPDSFFDFYESKGWLVGKVSMKDWRASARKWVRENSNGSNGNGKFANNSRRGLTADEVFG